MRTRSVKRAKQYTEYTVKRSVFMDAKNWTCEVCGLQTPDIQCHHKRGKIGNLLTDERFFLAVCFDCHRKIELNPNWAKAKGYSLSRLANEPHQI